MVCGLEQLANAKPPALHVNVTVTIELFQPAALGDGDTEAVIVGGAGAVVTMRLTWAVKKLNLAVMLVLPLAIAVTKPFAPIVATLLFEELQTD
jgi:hypothetical protein